MLDAVAFLAFAALFGLAAVYVLGCDRLKGGSQ
jgi:hypothetical protein